MEPVAFREAGQCLLALESFAGAAGGQMDFKGGAVLSNEMIGDYIVWRKDNTSDDLMTELLTAEFEDEYGVTRTLTRYEVLTYVTVVAGAGNETTGRLIGWMGSVLAPRTWNSMVTDTARSRADIGAASLDALRGDGRAGLAEAALRGPC